MILEALDVHVDLSGNHVLCGVDLSLSPGEFVALLGPNGSGKSTFVRAAVGLIGHTGTIRLFGQDLADFRERWRLGYVPQRPASVAGVPSTVREVVASGLLARRPRFGLPSRADRAAVEEAIASVRLSHKASSPLHELSGGQQQRAHIARALVGRPELLIMDEPTAGVDAASTEILTQLLAGLTAAGTGVLMVTHEMGPLRDHITRAIVLEAGLVVHDGPVSQISDEHDEAHHHPHSSEPERLSPVPEEGPLT